MLELVGLGAVRGKQIKALSGGMRRRVALAQALLGDPDLLVLDEPTAGLDPEQRLRFRELVSRLGEGRTVLLSTHQTEDVVALAQQVLVLHLGRLRFAGTPLELAGLARGHVWHSQERDPGALAAWRTGTGAPVPVRQAARAPGSRSWLCHTCPLASPASSSGVPTKRSLPRCSTRTCWASATTSSVWWVDSSTVRPSPSRETRSRKRSRCSGSRPAVGSSSTSRSGSPSSAWASATRRRMPPDSALICLPRTAPSPTSSSTRRTSWWRVRRWCSSLRMAT